MNINNNKNIINILKIIIIILFNYYINNKKNLTQRKKLILTFFKSKNNNQLISKNITKKLVSLEKKELLHLISTHVGKKIKFVKSILINNNFRFGNKLILIKKIIFYCQILGCKKIILSNNNWFIKNKIIIKNIK